MFAPGAASLAEEFRITSSTIVSLTVSIYHAGFAIGPMFIAPLSELYGRLVIYHACSVVYIGFIIGCALAKNTGMFLAFRFLAGCAASGLSTVGGGTVADVIPPAQRGMAISLFFVGPLLGPVSRINLCRLSEMLTTLQGHGPGYWRLRFQVNWLALDVLDHLDTGEWKPPCCTPFADI